MDIYALSPEGEQDLTRLCFLLNQKNELQTRRHQARRQERKYRIAYGEKRTLGGLRRLQAFADLSRNRTYLNLKRMQAIALRMGDHYTDVVKSEIRAAIESICTDSIEASEKLRKQGNVTWLSNKKLLAKSPTELKMLQREWDIKNKQIELNIWKFTQSFRKEIASICRRYGWRVITNGQSAWYESIMVQANGNILIKNRFDIARRASSQALENSITDTNSK